MQSVTFMVKAVWQRLRTSVGWCKTQLPQVSTSLRQKSNTSIRQSTKSANQSTGLYVLSRHTPFNQTQIAILLTVSSIGFASLQQSAFFTALRRVYLLDHSQWPRLCHLEMMGIKVKYPEVITGIPGMNETRGFTNLQQSVARNASVSLLIRAELPRINNEQRRLPRLCEFLVRTADGQRGRLPMSKVGGTSDGFQNYSFYLKTV